MKLDKSYTFNTVSNYAGIEISIYHMAANEQQSYIDWVT